MAAAAGYIGRSLTAMTCPECLYWNWLPDPDLVALASFPMLVFGLVLALLEIRYPHIVARVENRVRNSGPRLRNSPLYESLGGFWHGQWTKEARNGALFMVVVTGIFQALYCIIMIKSVLAFAGTWIALTLIGMLGMRFSESRDEFARILCLSIIMGTCIQIVMAYGLALLVSRAAARALAYFDGTGGKALGRIGLTLAALGLLCEAYQLARLSRVEYWTVMVLTPLALWLALIFSRRLLPRAEVQRELLHADEAQDVLQP